MHAFVRSSGQEVLAFPSLLTTYYLEMSSLCRNVPDVSCAPIHTWAFGNFFNHSRKVKLWFKEGVTPNQIAYPGSGFCQVESKMKKKS